MFFILVEIIFSNPKTEVSIVREVIGFSVVFGMFFLLLIAFWGLAKRKMYGKWLGLISLIIVCCIFILRTIETYFVDSESKVPLLALALVLSWCGVLITLIFRLS